VRETHLIGGLPRKQLEGTPAAYLDCEDAAANPEKRSIMVNSSDLIRQAKELREQAEHQADESIRNRLNSMADHYAHLAESQNWSETHPADAASLSDVFTKRE
jgi:hypothetical protein